MGKSSITPPPPKKKKKYFFIFTRLREISPDLMSELISSAHLFVMQTEFSVYVLLRLWMFLQLHPAWDGEPQDAVAASQGGFKKLWNFQLERVGGQKKRKIF